jgi:hypothetical protein
LSDIDEIQEFARVKPTIAAAELGRFMNAMRRHQDIVVSTDPDDTVWSDTADLLEEVCARLDRLDRRTKTVREGHHE